jgi:beta-glucanase (GH16 family)
LWLIDGQLVQEFADKANICSSPMYLIANLAVGGSWPGDPDASTTFPQSLLIDYVRVWQRS